MPKRQIVFGVGEYYHCFNRGVNKQPIFENLRDYKRALQTLWFYSFKYPPLRYSQYTNLPAEKKVEIIRILREKHAKIVDIISFVLMPNHFHFLLKQSEEIGVSKFLANFQNSYSRYFNTKHERIGPLFQGQFKAVRIEDDNQLLHVSRYIHLNPVTAYLIKNTSLLESYLWSSYPEYIGKSRVRLCTPNIILSQFRELKDYKNFIYDQSSYQQELARIKHLIIDEK